MRLRFFGLGKKKEASPSEDRVRTIYIVIFKEDHGINKKAVGAVLGHFIETEQLLEPLDWKSTLTVRYHDKDLTTGPPDDRFYLVLTKMLELLYPPIVNYIDNRDEWTAIHDLELQIASINSKGGHVKAVRIVQMNRGLI